MCSTYDYDEEFAENMSCIDFALNAKLQPEEDETEREIKITNVILQTIASCKTLLCFFLL